MTSSTASPCSPIRTDLRRTVRERIIRGELAPGTRIKEARLAEELGVSRTPLREALINLEQEGFVRSELARGFSVAPLSGREIRESYPLVWTLECLALRSCGAAVSSLLGRLSDINEAFAAATAAGDRLELDRNWHEALLSHCPNQRLNALLCGLRTALRRYERMFMSDAGLVTEAVRQHRQVIEALQARDSEAAERSLTENWRVSMELLLVRLGEP
jgi:DNA-binding GntR family transcriptional regulator